MYSKSILETLKFVCNFKEKNTVYVLVAIARKKDNPLTSSKEIVFREVIKRDEDIIRKYNRLKAQAQYYKDENGRKYNFYIYVTLNSRNTVKAFFDIQETMLDWTREYFHGVDISNKLKKVDEYWFSSLMTDKSRKSKLFLIDVDTKNIFDFNNIMDLFKKYTTVLYVIETRNGFHIVVEPFNRNNMLDDDLYVRNKDKFELKKDSLLFLEYIDSGCIMCED